jgi:succinate dehydrogenase/fumarate reductase cytochrome b subunit
MEAIEQIFDMFHSLSVVVIVFLLALTALVSWLMVRVFKGDFDNNTSQF